MEVDVHKQGNTHVLKLHGAFRLGPAVESFRHAVDEIVREGGSQIVLNLTEVNSMDSSGIGALVRSQTALKHHGGTIKLVNPSKLVYQTLKFVGLINIFEVHPDEAAALHSFGNGVTDAAGNSH